MKSSQINLLLVEDNEDDVELTKIALGNADFTVKLWVAKNGKEATDFLFKKAPFENAPTPDLILLDLNMPLKNGREVLKEVKQNPKTRMVPVIVLTSSEDEQDIENSYSDHANCYIPKPVSFAVFKKILAVLEEFWFHTVKLPSASSDDNNDKKPSTNPPN